MRTALALAILVGLLAMVGCIPDPPAELEQVDSERWGACKAGYVCGDGTMIIRATLTDSDSEDVLLEVEVKPLSVPFDGTGLLAGLAVPTGQKATVELPALPVGDYHWRARAVDISAEIGDWVAFDVDPAADFSVSYVAPSSLEQAAEPQAPAMPVGFADEDHRVSFRAWVTTPTPGRSVWMQVEVKPSDVPFDGVEPFEGTVVPAQAGTSEIHNVELPDGAYHWRARTMDSTGLATEWKEFDAMPDADFLSGVPPVTVDHESRRFCQNGAAGSAGGWLWLLVLLGVAGAYFRARTSA